ncbi:hypothetical protein ACPUEK_08370 [Marinomonas gallaica]|uniref:hypothetical protein n=1 Tax=Marinomonas gallaica TaxID=1806667 RepID=UPI003CE44F4F
MNKKIYVIDRNVLSDIKKMASGQKSKVSKEHRKVIKQMDHRGAVICTLVAAREGRSRSVEDADAIQATLIDNANGLTGGFFKYAKIDVLHNINMSESFIEGFEGEYLEDIKNSGGEEFVQAAARIVSHQKIKESKQWEQFQKLVALAKEKGIYSGSPVLWCMSAAIFGNESARKLMKIKEAGITSTYNFLNDIFFLKRYWNFCHHMKRNNEYAPVIPVTFDKALKKYAEDFELRSTKTVQLNDEEGVFSAEIDLRDGIFNRSTSEVLDYINNELNVFKLRYMLNM